MNTSSKITKFLALALCAVVVGSLQVTSSVACGREKPETPEERKKGFYRNMRGSTPVRKQLERKELKSGKEEDGVKPRILFGVKEDGNGVLEDGEVGEVGDDGLSARLAKLETGYDDLKKEQLLLKKSTVKYCCWQGLKCAGIVALGLSAYAAYHWEAVLADVSHVYNLWTNGPNFYY